MKLINNETIPILKLNVIGVVRSIMKGVRYKILKDPYKQITNTACKTSPRDSRSTNQIGGMTVKVTSCIQRFRLLF